MAVAHHLPQPWFDVQARGGQPAVALARVLPVVNLRTAFLDERIDGLQTVRRFQRPTQHAVQPEAMQRQGLGQAFRQAAGRRLVPIVQLALELLERAQRLVVRRPVVRALEALTPHRLLVLGQASLKISNSVRFLGWRHDLAALYATLDVVVLSSRNDGTPVSVIEAMAAGRAVVATDVGGVGDVIDHEETGVLVPVARPDALAEAIQRLATDEAARRRLGSSARRSVAARFSAVRLVDDVDRRYRDDLAAKRRGAALAR